MAQRWSENTLRQAVAGSDVVMPKRGRHGGRTRHSDENATSTQIKRAQRLSLQCKFAGMWQMRLRERFGADVPHVLQLDPEFQFDACVQWRIDFALPAMRVMIEIDGGTWSEERTGHNWGPGLTNDHVKQNAATRQGWRPFRLSSDMLTDEHVQPIFDFAAGQVGAERLYSVSLDAISECVDLGVWGDDDHPVRHYYTLSDSVLVASWVELPHVEDWGGSCEVIHFAIGYGHVPESLRSRSTAGRRRLVVVYA